jgi:hypothetical protein
MLKPGRSLAITWLFVSVSWACSGNEDRSHTGSETGGSAGALGGSSGAAGRASNGGDSVKGGAGAGGSESGGIGGGTSGSGGMLAGGAGSGVEGSEAGFWCDLSDTEVCKCRTGPKPNAAAKASCPASDCCVRTGAGDNRSCACSKPDSLFTCQDVMNYVSGAIVVASCPF